MPVEQLGDKVVLKHPKGASVEVMHYGATVISWKTGGLERLFVSSKAALDGSKPVRGGIPVVFPCFGAPTHPQHLKLSQHGFARSEKWTLDGIVMDNEAGVSVRFTLKPTNEIASKYEPKFDLAYVVTLAEHQLSTDLHVTNPPDSTQPLEFQALLHTYYRAPSASVRITPLQNIGYYDKTQATNEERAARRIESREEVVINRFTDSVYEDAPGEYTVAWPDGKFSIKTKNFKDVVVWNPQEEGRKIGDMEDGGWERYVCVEPGHVRGFATIHQIDYTLITPGVLDRSRYPRVPVIRIYGQSSIGLRTCLHVHQVYPYCYIEYSGKLHPRHGATGYSIIYKPTTLTDLFAVKNYIRNLKQSLNHAIALSLKRDPNSLKSQYVRSIFLVKGVKFYGFHSQYSPFLKILLLDPRLMNRITAILQSGSVLSRRFEVYESHLGYILQFMCDFGLYGCGSLHLKDVYRRKGLEEDEELLEIPEVSLETSPYARQTRMPLELDIISPSILNRGKLAERKLHHTLAIPAPERPIEPLVTSVRELWEDERNRRRAQGLEPTPELPNDPSEASRKPNSDWVAEARWWDEIRNRLEKERSEITQHPQATGSSRWEGQVMTVFESIEALWEAQHREWKPQKIEDDTSDQGDKEKQDNSALSIIEDFAEGGEVDVDEALLVSETNEQFEITEDLELYGEEDARDEIYDEAGEEQEGEEEQEDQADVDIADIDEGNFEADVADDTISGDRSSPDPFVDDGKTPASGLFAKGVVRNSHPAVEGEDETAGEENRHLTSQEHSETPETRTRELPVASRPPFLATASRTLTFQLTRAEQRSIESGKNCFTYSRVPPSRADLIASLEAYKLPMKVYKSPFYSNEYDAPERPREFAGLVYHLKGGEGIASLEDFVLISPQEPPSQLCYSKPVFEPQLGWEYASLPPSRKSVGRWAKQEQLTQKKAEQVARRKAMRSQVRVMVFAPKDSFDNPYFIPLIYQIEGPTQFNIYGFKHSPLDRAVRSSREKQNMTLMCLEVMAPAFEKTVPDPESDPICIAVYGLQVAGTDDIHTGIIAIQNVQLNHRRIRDLYLDLVDTELDLLNRISDIVSEFDPDILTGWEVQRGSWGYLDSRAKQYEFDLQDFLSRAPAQKTGGDDRWGSQTASSLKVAGRHVLNTWRIMRSEQALTSYTLSNVAFHVLQQRIPFYSTATLSMWYDSPVASHMVTLLRYMFTCVCTTLRILEESEVVTKTAEFARIFGVDFYSVISRGSQFKVESFMFRIAKPENFVLISPSKSDVGKQNAAECMPLIMEPMSAFYSSPLVVLDFQSLYPSVMIAYNYCYSTCLGRITPFQEEYKFGVTNLDIPPSTLDAVKEYITVAPNGIMYAKPQVLSRVLNARQLALKYIANVTYGYTGATYSGRMPAVEIADSIVQTGRETLEKVNMVVYGDTDSLFIEYNNIPEPGAVKLKFEKVYHPCVLMAKKRYVGFKYESPDEREPTFDAKGIETVRRDGVLAQRKLVENCLKILFRTQDLSLVKEYCCRSWYKILENRVPVQDFIFAKEVRLGTYSDKGPPPPGVVVAARRIMLDPNDEPQYGERIPYVITRGEPGALLTERAMDPLEMINEPHLQLDANYYITRVLIPPLERIFNLVGADVQQWFSEMPKVKNVVWDTILASPSKRKKEMEDDEEFPASPGRQWDIEEHLENSQCLACGEPSFADLCDYCLLSPQSSVTVLGAKGGAFEHRLLTAHKVCASCAGITPGEPVECISLDCPWLYTRKKAEARTEAVETMEILVDELEKSRQRRELIGSEEEAEGSETSQVDVEIDM
ncbi:hypothetical protein NP233_g970 [Leucocoprinus birnbaumii]|uniref:DNA polymerase n=1 Tax=Leucocoprinus birnbaumii TaxID=56174 RepID=A0AAD5W3Q6_9AGAR|nr:hypothetical protein NP233_g970 [Leucocoprinus birnbaumii]